MIFNQSNHNAGDVVNIGVDPLAAVRRELSAVSNADAAGFSELVLASQALAELEFAAAMPDRERLRYARHMLVLLRSAAWDAFKTAVKSHVAAELAKPRVV